MKQQKLLAALLCAATPLAYAANEGDLGEIVVTASRVAQPINQSINSTTVLTRQDILASQTSDVLTLLRGLAGVEVSQNGDIGKLGSLFLRGTNSTHTLVLLDGVRVNSATSGATAIDQIMLDQVERIEVVRGNVSSLYGSEAIGGVVQIFTRRGAGKPDLDVSGSMGTHNTQRLSVGFGGQADSTSFSARLSGFKTRGVSAIKPDIVPGVNPDSDGYRNTSLSAHLNHAFDAENGLSASIFDSRGDSQNDNPYWPATATDAHTSKSGLQKFALVSENRPGAAWQSKLQLARGVDDSQNFLNGAPDIALGALFKTTSDQVLWQNTLQLGDRQNLNLGVEYLGQRVDSSTIFARNKRTATSLFAGYTGNHGAHQAQLNLRQDRYDDFGAANTGMLGYGYAISSAWRATASLSTAFKAPTLNDLFYPFTNFGFGWTYQGNPNLAPERSRNKELGLHYESGGQRLDVSYFDNRIRDLIAGNGLMAGTVINLDEARCDGFEAGYAGQFGGTAVKAALTLQNPRNTKTGLALVRRANAYGNLGIAHQTGAWQIGGELQYSGSRTDYDINTSARTSLAGYQIVNLTASYNIDRRIKLTLRADNLFNRDYMLVHGFGTTGRTLLVGANYRQ